MKNTTAKARASLIKTLLAAALMVGTATLIFQSLTQVAVAAENNQITTLPTVYPASIRLTPKAAPDKAPNGYAKPHYTVVDNSLEFYRANRPVPNALSRDNAAEIGVQALWSVFDLDLNGKTIEMGYTPARNVIRAKWLGEYWVDGKKGPDHPLYTFTIDAITGEVYDVRYGRILHKKVNVGYDAELANNPAAMEGIAKKYATDLKVTGGSVKSSTISSQGYTVDDPTATFRIVGTNGQLAIIGLSRYDNALLSVNYHGSVVEIDAQIAQIERDAAAADRP